METEPILSTLPSRNKSLVITTKNYAEDCIRSFCSCPILLDFFALFHWFFTGLHIPKVPKVPWKVPSYEDLRLKFREVTII